MNVRSSHPAGRETTRPTPLHDDTIEAGSPVTLGPACCCPAHPVVRVIMPATANATVTELPGPAGSPPDALLPDLPGPRVPVS